MRQSHEPSRPGITPPLHRHRIPSSHNRHTGRIESDSASCRPSSAQTRKTSPAAPPATGWFAADCRRPNPGESLLPCGPDTSDRIFVVRSCLFIFSVIFLYGISGAMRKVGLCVNWEIEGHCWPTTVYSRREHFSPLLVYRKRTAVCDVSCVCSSRAA